jgi:hypothetical protein
MYTSSGTTVAGHTLTAADIASLGMLSNATSGNAATATLATMATNIAGGALGSIPYQSSAGVTAFLASPATNGTYLEAWILTSSAAVAPTAVNLTTLFTSPTFTGTPMAPTATAGTNTTQLATTAFVQTATSGSMTGTAAMAVNSTEVGGIAISGTPVVGDVPVATSTTAATWQVLNVAGLVSSVFVAETPAGTAPTTTYTLSHTPVVIIAVYVNGVMQRPTVDYTVSGATVTLVNATTNSTDTVSAVYLD